MCGRRTANTSAGFSNMAKSTRAKTKRAGKLRPRRGGARQSATAQREGELRKRGGGDGAEQDQSQVEDVLPASSAEFAIVGVGASAGGLEAFTQFLHAMPADTGGRVAAFYADLVRAQALLALYRETILPQAQATVTSAQAAYRWASVAVVTLLDAPRSGSR